MLRAGVKMDFYTEKKSNYTLIQVLQSRLDQELTPALKLSLVQISGSGEKNMVFDLSACRFCNSSGLSSLLIANRLCKNAGGKLILFGLDDALILLIKETQLNRLFRTVESEAQAAEALHS